MNKLVRGLTALLIVVMVISTSSCRQNAGRLNELDGTHWRLQSINGNGLVEGSYISLYFCWGRIRGYSGCNTYGAEYTVESLGKLRFSEGMFTLLACSKEINDQETSYTAAIRTTELYHLEGDKLILSNASGQPQLVFLKLPKYAVNPASLTNTKWRLVAMEGIPVSEDLNATVNFDDSGNAQGSAGPYNFEFKYQAKGDDIWWTTQAAKRVTMATAPTDGEAGHFLSALGCAATYRLVNGQLEIFAITGKDSLLFEPIAVTPGSTR